MGEKGEIRTKLLHDLHASAVGGHSRMRATYKRVKKLLYWPRLKKQVEQLVAKCPVCQLNKSKNVHSPGLLDPLEIPDLAWTHISMDFIEGLPKSRGKNVILVVVDRLTKYAHFIALAHPYTV